MVWAARYIAALAPFYLFFSISMAHGQVPRCLEVFKIDFDGRYDHALSLYLAQSKGLSAKEVVALEMFPRMLHVVRARLRETGTQFIDVVNPAGKVHAIEILPEGPSELNKTARHFQNKYQALLRVAVDEPHLVSGVTQGLNAVTGEYVSMYLMGLEAFLKNKISPRNFIYRHESRHLGYVQKVVKAMEQDRVVFSAGGIVALPETLGFSPDSLIALKRDPKDPVSPQILAYDEGYREMLSLEELWNYSRDLQFMAGSFTRTLPEHSFQQVKHQMSKILGGALKLMALLDRVAQLRTEYEPMQFFTAYSYKEGSSARLNIQTHDELKRTPWLESQTWSFLYGHDIVHGFFFLKSQNQQERNFLLSLPIAKSSDNLSLAELQQRMDVRSDQISLAATRYRYRLANVYQDLFLKYHRWIGDLPSSESDEVLGQQLFDSVVALRKTVAQESIKFK